MTVVYAYAGYPLVLAGLAKLRSRPVHVANDASQRLPSVSIVLPARNEVGSIARRVREFQSWIIDARDLCGEIVVFPDGSTDATAEIARELAGGAVPLHVIELTENVGKAAALTAGYLAATNEILVLADARQRGPTTPSPGSSRTSPTPKSAASAVELVIESKPGVMAGVGLYWRYETWIRRNEGAVHSTVGVSGSISAVRRVLFPEILPARSWTMCTGPSSWRCRAVASSYDARARAFDRLPDDVGSEFRRKVRTLSGNFQLIPRLPSALVPTRNPVWFALVSHKLLRLVVPWALLRRWSRRRVSEGCFMAGSYGASDAVLIGLVGLVPSVAGTIENRVGLGFIPRVECGRVGRVLGVGFGPVGTDLDQDHLSPEFVAFARSRRGRPVIAHFDGSRRSRLSRPSTPVKRRSGPVHLILAIADHFEPHSGGINHGGRPGTRRELGSRLPSRTRCVSGRRWLSPTSYVFLPDGRLRSRTSRYPRRFCRQGFGEVEIHLHHDGDTAENLRETLENAVRIFSGRHGLLARQRDTMSMAYGFVHGNWALNNARPDGRWCGVNDEIRILCQTGCYADFTYPSAPSPTQPPTINRLYYARSKPHTPRGHDHGTKIGHGTAPEGSLMLITGPLGLNWRSRKWGVLPRLENGCVQASQPATINRLELWLSARVQVPSRPDWYFVKLHAHGAPERDRECLLGPPMIEFHRELARRAELDPNFHVHYVTAREMYNLARAAESGWKGTIAEARDFEIVWDGHHAVETKPTRVGEFNIHD